LFDLKLANEHWFGVRLKNVDVRSLRRHAIELSCAPADVASVVAKLDDNDNDNDNDKDNDNDDDDDDDDDDGDGDAKGLSRRAFVTLFVALLRERNDDDAIAAWYVVRVLL
jgi:hypothetical protein